MRTFAYERPPDVASAITAVSSEPGAAFLAGGTTQLDLMKDGIWEPTRLVDLGRLPLRGVAANRDVLRVGALTTMEELAADPVVVGRLPLVREALLAGASTQLRNMATVGGNLLQRTRCRYYRDPAVAACNKRQPGTGCAAVAGLARMHAILGVSERCIALHASDLAVALVALDAVVGLDGPHGQRRVPLTEFYIAASERPDVENVLGHGELITHVEIPLLGAGARSGYLKVRDRASYEFALTSAAVALRIEEGIIREARIGLGGVGSTPWRAAGSESVLRGAAPTTATLRDAAEIAVQAAWTVPGTAFKVELAKRTVLRMLETVAEAAR